MRNVTKSQPKGQVFPYVRWSSAQQSLGDSERRQVEAAQRYAQQQGMELSEEKFTDPGLSAWHGDHRKEGKLGALLKRVKEGDAIAIESYSRWSREHPLDGLNALRETTDRGVKVHFTSYGMTISRSNFREMFPLLSLHAQLSNAENEERSYRIRESMKGRRAKIETGRAVPGAMPCWLKWAGPKDSGKVAVIEERAEVVRRIFKMSLQGMGVGSIIRELQDTPCITRSLSNKNARWNTRTVYRILTDKSVIGHYNRNGLSVPGVFPAIVSEADFYTSLEKMKARRNFTAPRKYENTSLFTGLGKCSVCGSSLIKVRCGHNGKYYDYLCCSQGVRPAKKQDRCRVHSRGIRYDVLEDSFLGLLSLQADVRAALSTEAPDSSKLDALKGELCDVQARASKWMRAMDEADSEPKRVLQAIAELEDREAKLTVEIEAETARIEAASATPPMRAYEQLQSELQTPILELNRSNVRLLLRNLIEKVVVTLGDDSFMVHFKNGRRPLGARIGWWAESVAGA